MPLPSLSALPPLGVAFSLSPFSRAQRGQLCLLSSVCRPHEEPFPSPLSVCPSLLVFELGVLGQGGLDNHGREGPRLKVGGGAGGENS